jgi:hypothetical protein
MRDRLLDYNRSAEEHAGPWQSPVSSWMRAIHQSESFLKKKAFKRFSLKTMPKKEMYLAFEAHGLLVRGFHKLRRAIRNKRVRRFRRRSLMKKSFIQWQVNSTHVTVSPRRRGAMIYACFKWISQTLCKEKPAYYSQWIGVEKDLSNRVRNYIFGFLELPPKKVPLLLHSIAILDTFLLRSLFVRWAKHVRRIKAFTMRVTERHKQVVFQFWRSQAHNAHKWRVADLLIYRRHSHRVARSFFSEWITIYRSSVYVRTVKRLRLLHGALAVWSSRKHQTCAATKALRARSTRHKHSMAAAMSQWQRMCRWRGVFAQVGGLAIHHHKTSAMSRCLQTWINRIYSRHHLRTKHWGLDALSIRTYTSQEKWKGSPYSSVFVSRGDNTLDSFSDAILYTSRQRKVGYVLSSRLRWAIFKWRDNLKYNKDLYSRSRFVRGRRNTRLLEMMFGVWMLKGVHLMGIKRSANRVVINRFRRVLTKSFTHWKTSAIERIKYREELKKRELERLKSLQDRLVLWGRVSAHVSCNRHFTAWKRHVWHLKVGRAMRPPIVNYVHKRWLLLAFRKWNAASYEMVIVCCIQKLWRGFVVRHLHNRSQYAYIKWITSGHLRRAMRMCAYNSKKKALRGWLVYVNSYRHTRELRSMRVVQRRALTSLRHRVDELSWQRGKLRRGYVYWELKCYLNVLRVLKNDATLQRRTVVFHRRCRHRRFRAALRLLGSFLPRYAAKPSLVWRRRFDMSKEEGLFACRRYLTKWRVSTHSHRRARRQKQAARLIMLSKYVTVFRAWQWRAHRWARTADHPILAAHKHYIRRLRKTAFHRFRWNLSNLTVSFRRQWRLVTAIDRKYNRKRARTALLVWFRVISRTRAVAQTATRVTTRPIFLAWHRTFQIFRRNRLRIYKVRVKTMRRIARGVFLAWSLHTLRSTRLKKSCHRLHLVTLANHRRKAWNVWREARRNIQLQSIEQIVRARYTRRSRADTLRIWKMVYRMSSEQTWQNVQIIFNHWARLTADEHIGRDAHMVGANYHSVTSLRKAIVKWRDRIQAVKYMQHNEFEGRKAMLMSRCIQMLRYWRCWSWWMGRRVLYGRVRMLGFDHHVVRESPRPMLPSRFASTPFRPDRTGRVEFSMSPAYYNSQLDFTGGSVMSHGGSFYDLDDDPHRSMVIQGSARLRAIKKKHFRLSSRLLVKGRTPLAMEAAALRALRVWRKNVRKYLESKRDNLLATTFQSWKRYCKDNTHRRLALVSRIKNFQRTFFLQYFFGRLFETCKVGILLKRKDLILRKRHLKRLWDSWLLSTKLRHAHKRRKRNALLLFTQSVSEGNTRNMRRLFQVWKVRVYLCGPASKRRRRAMMLNAFDNWTKLQAANTHRNRVLKAKAFARWTSRAHKIAGAREAVLAKQRGATVVRMR